MKKQHSCNISKKYTSGSQWQMLQASKLSVKNARSHFHRKTNCGNIYSSVEMRTNLFLVQNVTMLSGIRTVYVFIILKQKHPQRAGDHSAYYRCLFCPKEYTFISSRRRHMKGVHKKSKCWVGLSVSRSRTIASNVLVN